MVNVKYCIEFELSSCGKKRCCYECDEAHCDQRCKIDSEKCKSVTDKEPKSYEEGKE